MSVLEKANEMFGQVAGFATVSIGDLIGSAFMTVVMFFVDMMLGQ